MKAAQIFPKLHGRFRFQAESAKMEVLAYFSSLQNPFVFCTAQDNKIKIESQYFFIALNEFIFYLGDKQNGVY